MDNKDNERLERGRLKYLEYIKKAREKRTKGSYKTKIIISGSFIEEYIYQNEITLGRKAVRRKKRKNKPKRRTNRNAKRSPKTNQNDHYAPRKQ